MGFIYGSGAGDAIPNAQGPDATYGQGGVGERFNALQYAVGDAAAIKKETFTAKNLDAGGAGAVVQYWTAPYACRIRGINLISSQTTVDGGNPQVTFAAAIGATDIVASTTFDSSPQLVADTLKALNSGSTPAVQNYEAIAQNDVLKLSTTFGGSSGASATVQIEIIYEPRLADTSKTTQATRSYLDATRSKDS